MTDNGTTPKPAAEHLGPHGAPEVQLPPRPKPGKPWGRYVFLALLVGAAFYAGRVTHHASPAGQAATAKKAVKYHCPMHPTIYYDHPGDCPICGMKMVPVENEGEGAATSGPKGPASNVPGRAAVTVSPDKQQLIGMRKAVVKRELATKTIRTVGMVDVNDTLTSRVHTKIEGWVEKVYVDFEGKFVRRGQPLLTIYSPDLLSTEEEYLLALRSEKELSYSSFSNVRAGGESLVEATRRRLLLWDIPESEIRKIAETGKTIHALTLYSPVTGYVTKRNGIEGMHVTPNTDLYSVADLSSVWVLGDVYENDMPLIHEGLHATLTTDAHPGRVFNGVVDYIFPDVDTKTRTVKARFTFRNPGLILRPGMYTNVTLQIPLGHKLVVPSEAVLDSGVRKVVFLVGPGDTFIPRTIQTGEMVGDDYVVLSGLKQGDQVVANGNFVIDSESSLKAAAGNMGSMPGMNMGGSSKSSAKSSGTKSMPGMKMNQMQSSQSSSMPGMDMSKAPSGSAASSGQPTSHVTLTEEKPHHHEAATRSTGNKTSVAGAGKSATASHGKQKSGDYYTCLMHPEVHSDKPGRCPKCGMFLVKASSIHK